MNATQTRRRKRQNSILLCVLGFYKSDGMMRGRQVETGALANVSHRLDPILLRQKGTNFGSKRLR